jgi:hypothetical protein
MYSFVTKVRNDQDPRIAEHGEIKILSQFNFK